MPRSHRKHSTLAVKLVLTSFLALDPRGALAQGNMTVSTELPASPKPTNFLELASVFLAQFEEPYNMDDVYYIAWQMGEQQTRSIREYESLLKNVENLQAELDSARAYEATDPASRAYKSYRVDRAKRSLDDAMKLLKSFEDRHSESEMIEIKSKMWKGPRPDATRIGVTPEAGSMWPTLNRFHQVSTASAFGVDTSAQPVSTSIALDENKRISFNGYTGKTRTDPSAAGSGSRADTEGMSLVYMVTDDRGDDKKRFWGLNGGIGDGKVRSVSSPDSTSTDSWNIGALGGLQWQNGGYMATAVGFSENRSKSQRFTVDGGLPAVALSSFTGRDTSGSIELGRSYRLGERAPGKDGGEKTASARQSRRASWDLTPQMALQLRHFEQDAFTETGAGASSLHIGVIQVDTCQGSVGARLSRPTPTSSGGMFVPQLTLRYAHEFGDTHANIVSSFVGTSTTVVSESSRLSRDSVQVSAGATLSTRGSWDLSANYSGQFASNYENQAATAAATYKFH